MELGAASLYPIGIVLIALLIRPIVQRTCMSYSFVLVILGYFAAELLIAFGLDTGIRAELFQKIVLYLFLPTLVFHAAYKNNFSAIWTNIGNVSYFTLWIFLSFLLISAIIYYGIHHPSFPWIAAFITASVLLSTSSTAVTDILEKYCHYQKEKIVRLMEFESLLSGVLSVVIFNVLISIATISSSTQLSAANLLLEFIEMVAGGIFVGVMVGGLSLGLLILNKDARFQATLTIITVYFAYILAEDVLAVSGVFAVAIIGIVYKVFGKSLEKEKTSRFIGEFWDLANLIVYTIIFLLVGVTFQLNMFEERWLAILIAIAAFLSVRFIGVYLGQPLWQKWLPRSNVTTEERRLLMLECARGAVAIVLAFAIPTTVDYWWTIQSIVFGVVIFSLLFQMVLSCFFLRKSKHEKIN